LTRHKKLIILLYEYIFVYIFKQMGGSYSKRGYTVQSIGNVKCNGNITQSCDSGRSTVQSIENVKCTGNIVQSASSNSSDQAVTQHIKNADYGDGIAQIIKNDGSVPGTIEQKIHGESMVCTTICKDGVCTNTIRSISNN